MFYVAIGYGAFSFIGTFLVYFPPMHPRLDGKTKWQEFKELDFIGTLLFVAGLAVFLFGLNAGGNTFPWKSAGCLAPLILGLIVFISAFIYDFIVPKDPLFPWYLFRNFREFSALPVLVFVAGMVFFAASALNAETILYLHTPDPIKIGLYSLPSGYVPTLLLSTSGSIANETQCRPTNRRSPNPRPGAQNQIRPLPTSLRRLHANPLLRPCGLNHSPQPQLAHGLPILCHVALWLDHAELLYRCFSERSAARLRRGHWIDWDIQEYWRWRW